MTEAVPAPRPVSPRRHRTVALAGLALVCGMFGAAYAAVPLYDWFCRVTGIAGTTQVADTAPIQVLDQMVTVRFDSNVMNLPWTFEPPKPVKVRIGEVVTVHYTVTNTSERETVGTATFNVVPLITGAYFNKMDCFCFTEQTLKPGERVEMPVVFFVDPSIVEDAQTGAVTTITLSYTFFPVKDPTPPVDTSKRGTTTDAQG